MPKVTMSMELPSGVDKVWDVIGGFNAIANWHPAVEKSELSDGGEMRTLSLAGGGQIVERLEKLDDAGHSYRYSIVDSPLPVSNYTAEIQVQPNADGKSCTVQWSSDFKAAGAPDLEASKVIEGIYQAGFDNLKKMFGM